MYCKSIVFSLLILFCSQAVAAQKIIAVDGITGFVAPILIKNLPESNLKLGLHSYHGRRTLPSNIYVGDTYNPAYLKKFLKDVNIYYQMAAISSVNAKHTLEDYILTNSIAPYLASRINKSMTMIVMSSIAINDIAENDAINTWLGKFITHVRATVDKQPLTEEVIKSELHTFMVSNPPPKLNRNQYYGFSKYLLEKLLFKSTRTRTGHIYIIRPALIIGGDQRTHRGDAIVKNVLAAMFDDEQYYEVWNRINYYTPINKLTGLMFYLANSADEFAKFGIFDAGCVPMHQHAFVKKLCNVGHKRAHNIEFSENSKFDREVMMFKDVRLEQFYPEQPDIDEAMLEMIRAYEF